MVDCVPDLIELLDEKLNKLDDEYEYMDDKTCMICKRKFDYDMICTDPFGLGPLMCYDCAGIDPDKYESER